MMVIGGRTNQPGEGVALEVYDTDTSIWYKFLDISKFRHSVLLYETGLLIYGGFEPESPNIPTNKFFSVDLQIIFENIPALIKTSGFSQLLNESIQKTTKNSMLMGKVISEMKPELIIEEPKPTKKNIRMAPLAVIATVYGPNDNLNDIVKKIPIHHLQEESKKIGAANSNVNNNINDLNALQISSNEELAHYFLNILINPKNPIIKGFKLSKEMIIKLCDEVQKIVQSQPSLLNIRAPIKIFGNLHGQLDDLIKIFEHFGFPDDTLRGDIESNDYLFLGDYVDRGNKSLELICLLFALKLKHPDQIHLLRGHHEDKNVNYVLGFAEECMLKFPEDPKNPNSIFQRINKVFEYLPYCAVIENKILCVHGGIGQSVKTLKQIEKISRPVEISHNSVETSSDQILINELLWTDPTTNSLEEYDKSKRGLFGNDETRCCKFSFERTKNFLASNNLTLLIRSHEFVKEGYENLNNMIITLVSCLDYCGKLKNAGGILIVKKNSEIIPKMIIPGVNFESYGQKWNGLEPGVNSVFSGKEKKIRQNISPFFVHAHFCCCKKIIAKKKKPNLACHSNFTFNPEQPVM